MTRKLLYVLAAVVAAGGLFLLTRGGQPAAAQLTSRALTDQTGREISVPAHPARVVILSATHVDLFCAAGGGSRIVGKPISQVMSEEVKAASLQAREIGMSMSPDTELILSLNPDLVIGLNMPPHIALRPLLEQAGIPMFVQNVDTYEQVLELITLYGELSGTKERAAKSVAAIKADYARAIAKSSGKQAPSSLILWGTPESFSMGTKKSFIGDLVERLGGGNIMDKALNAGVGGSFLPLSMEYVTKEDPDIILLITHGSPEGLKEKFSRDMAGNPLWQGISAVKNNRLYTMPYHLFAVNPGSRIGDAINILADIMYDVQR
jgi:iron complex transport system substrate-binding protein